MYKYLKDNNKDLSGDSYKLNIKSLIKKESFTIDDANKYDR
jgi:hypothetical protein